MFIVLFSILVDRHILMNITLFVAFMFQGQSEATGSNSQKTKCRDVINVDPLMRHLLEEVAIYFEYHKQDTNTV